MIKIFSSFIFARNDTKTPFYFSLISVILNIVISVSLFSKLGFIIIPIATTISSWLNGFLLMVFVLNKNYFNFNNSFFTQLFKILISNYLNILKEIFVLFGILVLLFITNFIITPLAFLSGVFYTIDKLPSIFQTISYFNPFFHIINVFRYGFLGKSDGDLYFGVIYLPLLAIVGWVISYYLYKIGYKIKS